MKVIFEQLSREYDNEHRQLEAQEAFLAIGQNPNDSVVVYASKFERLIHQAKAQNLPHYLKIALIRHGLRAKVRSRLSAQPDISWLSLRVKRNRGP